MPSIEEPTPPPPPQPTQQQLPLDECQLLQHRLLQQQQPDANGAALHCLLLHGEDVCDSADASKLPTWYPPAPPAVTFHTGVCVKNSLTRTKVPFVTMTGTNQLTWYMYVINVRGILCAVCAIAMCVCVVVFRSGNGSSVTCTLV